MQVLEAKVKAKSLSVYCFPLMVLILLPIGVFFLLAPKLKQALFFHYTAY